MFDDRPLSPHLTWYKPQITSVLSILHRLTGIVLALGTIALIWWLIAIDVGGSFYAATVGFLSSPVGTLMLAGWSAALFYHLCNGVRHLAWDAGYGFELETVYRSGYAVLAVTAVLTLASWLIAALL